MRTCPVCDGSMVDAFSAKVLGRYDARYLHCPGCGFLQAADPVWLDEAYESAISAADTGIVQRNLQMSLRLGGLYAGWFGSTGRYADISGGSGMLVRLLRDLGFDAYWRDPYAENQFARGFEAERHESYSAVSAIEVLEHVESPVEFLKDCFETTGAKAVVFTTELYVGAPPMRDWWYYQFETGQHISFMERRTLEMVAQRLRCKLLSRRHFHALLAVDLPKAPFYMAATIAAPLQLALRHRHLASLTDADSEIVKRWMS